MTYSNRSDIRPFLYPVSGQITGFICRISGFLYFEQMRKEEQEKNRSVIDA